jgi:DNA-binding NarL/FixJ family response regulator
MTFSRYYLIRSLDETSSETINESSEFDVRKFIHDNKKIATLKKHIAYFSKKHPHARNCDLEDSIIAAFSEILNKKPTNERTANRILQKKVKDSLSEILKKGRDSRKNLSCLKSLKSFSRKGVNLDEIIGKAKGILTGKEKKVLEMCTEGKSVRQIALDMKTSFPTVWRTLNKALDKVRVSNGMRGRYKDKR